MALRTTLVHATDDDGGRRVSAENFLPSPQMAKFGGMAGRGGLLSLGSLELKMLSQCRTLYNGTILN